MSAQPEDKKLIVKFYKHNKLINQGEIANMGDLGFNYTPPSELSPRNLTPKNPRRSL